MLNSEIKTPDSIIRELIEIRDEASRGISVLYDCEIKLADASINAETIEAKSLINSTGNVAERQAQAKLESAEARLQEQLAKAEFNRVKTKLRLLEQAQMSVQTQARMVELTYRNSHI